MALPNVTLPIEGVENYKVQLRNMSGTATAHIRLGDGDWQDATYTESTTTVSALLAGASAVNPDDSAITVTGSAGDTVDVAIKVDSGLEQIILAAATIEIVDAA